MKLGEKSGEKKERLFPFFLILFIFVTCPLFVSLSLDNPQKEESLPTEIISLEKDPALLAALQSLRSEWDILLEMEGRIYLLVRPQDLPLLSSQGIIYRLETPLFPPAHPSSRETRPASGANGAYHSYQELRTELKSIAQRFPSIARLQEIGRSHEGRSILALKISDNAAWDEDEPAILFLGCHHAREWISVEVPFLIGRHLVEHYQDDPEIRKIVNEAQIWVVPLVNPDGLEYTIRTYRYWRKNRRMNDDGTFGVDLNRNYGFGWGIDNRGSSPEPASEVYRGPAPFSEPETRAIRNLFNIANFKALVSYHSYSQVILYPWGFTTQPTDKSQLLLELSRRMSDLMVAVNGRRYVFGQASTLLYLTNGDTTDWAFGVAGIPAFTIELPPVDILHGGFFNAEADIQPIFEENLVAALDLIRWSIEHHAAAGKENWSDRKQFPGKENVYRLKTTVGEGR